MDKNNNQLDKKIDDQLIAEMLCIAYASYCAKCDILLENPVGPRDFYDYYHRNIEEFRQIMHVDDGLKG